MMLIESANIWVPARFSSFVLFILSSIILFKEYKSRKTENITFTTKWLAICSIWSITCGSIALLLMSLVMFPGFCHLVAYFARIFIATQPLLLGFYQLSRLYYCFARDKVYSNKGYPNWLFILMIGLGIFFFGIQIFFGIIDHYVTSCGINNKFEAYRDYKNLIPSIHTTDSYTIGTTFAITGYHIWDFVTFMLCVIKIRSFTESGKASARDKNVTKRILSILNRISIITLFYEITGITALVLWFLFGRIGVMDVPLRGLPQFIYCYCMYIMLDHNKRAYHKFLGVLYRSRLYIMCFCCCKDMIVQQLEDMDMESNDNHRTLQIAQQIEPNSPTEQTEQTEDMECDTKTQSVVEYYLTIEKGNRSPETSIIV